MRKASSIAVIVASLCFCLTAQAADETALKCPISGKPASKDHAAKYKDGQVYFCCDNCPKAFEANTKKFATKANMQLVESKQYKQTKCPFSGEDVNPATAVKVGDLSVSFCCDKCKAKFEAAKEKKQLNMAFGDKAFDKAFVKNTDTAK
jgi:transcription elongation factor Elf1